MEPDDAVFKVATHKLYGVGLHAACSDEQLVARRNYLYAANAKAVYPGAKPYLVFVKVYQPYRARYRLPASLTPAITIKGINPAHNKRLWAGVPCAVNVYCCPV